MDRFDGILQLPELYLHCFDLALLGDGAPVPGGYAAAPVELERDGDRRAVVGRPEAGDVVAGL